MKPCPFCGGTELGVIDGGASFDSGRHDDWHVYCRCGAYGPATTEDGAEEAWNKRAEQ